MATNYNPKAVTSGLVLALDAANAKSYPGTGTTWTDLSGNGNNSTLINGVSYSTGILSLDGTNQRIDCGNAQIFSPQYLTASVMVRCNSFSTRPHLIGRGDGNSGNFYIVVETNSVVRFYNDIGAGWVVAANTTAFPLNTWTYVTVTHDGSLSKIYYNGVLQVSTSRIGTLRNWQSNTLQIGSILSGSSLINGSVSFASLYNRALSVDEIKQNFNAIRGRYSI